MSTVCPIPPVAVIAITVAIGLSGFSNSAQTHPNSATQLEQATNSVSIEDAGIDKFGIQKIYADAPQPVNNWAFDGNANDPRFMEQKIVKAGNGWFRPEDLTEMRVEVLS